jgi:hypothetical protein
LQRRSTRWNELSASRSVAATMSGTLLAVLCAGFWLDAWRATPLARTEMPLKATTATMSSAHRANARTCGMHLELFSQCWQPKGKASCPSNGTPCVRHGKMSAATSPGAIVVQADVNREATLAPTCGDRGASALQRFSLLEGALFSSNLSRFFIVLRCNATQAEIGTGWCRNYNWGCRRGSP